MKQSDINKNDGEPTEKLSEALTKELRRTKRTLAEVAKRVGYDEPLLRNHMMRNVFREEEAITFTNEVFGKKWSSEEIQKRYKVKWINTKRAEAKVKGSKKSIGKFQEYIDEVKKLNEPKRKSGVFVFYSALELMTNQEPEAIKIIMAHAEKGVTLLFVHASGWGLSNKWKEDLANAIQRNMTEDEFVNEMHAIKSHRVGEDTGNKISYQYIALPTHMPSRSLADLTCRTGAAAFMPERLLKDYKKPAMLTFDYLRRLEVEDAWIQFNTSAFSASAEGSDSIRLKNVSRLSASFVNFWQEIQRFTTEDASTTVSPLGAGEVVPLLSKWEEIYSEGKA